MRLETLKFLEHVIWKKNGTLQSLLTSNEGFVTPRTASLYGLPVPNEAWTHVQFDPKQRSGLLTHPSVLTHRAAPNGTSPVFRGEFILERFFCIKLPSPPDNLDTQLKPVEGPLTTRQRFAVHTQNPACASCHRMLDPLGFGFENFDAIGRFRHKENGFLVDASGTLEGTRDANGKFSGAIELSKILSSSSQVQECFTTQLFRYAMGRTERKMDDCSLAKAHHSFSKSDFNIQTLILSLVETDAFIYRSSPR